VLAKDVSSLAVMQWRVADAMRFAFGAIRLFAVVHASNSAHANTREGDKLILSNLHGGASPIAVLAPCR
jgi:hypothetical protein